MNTDLAKAVDRLYAAVTDMESELRAAGAAAEARDPMAPAAGIVSEPAHWGDEPVDQTDERVTMPSDREAGTVKPGVKTTEFWAMVLANVGALAAANQDALPPRYAALVSAVSVSAYAISRALAKF